MDWSAKWLLTFHPDKCKHMHITRNVNEIAERTYSLSPHQKLEVIREEKDIGVYIDHNLSFDKHISAISNKANSMFAVLRRSFQFIDKETFVPLYKTLVRTHLDYASPVYNPYKVKHIEQLEAVQRRATRQIPGMTGKSYCERLRALNLPTLSYRRIRGDMTEIYKIIKKNTTATPPNSLNSKRTWLKGKDPGVTQIKCSPKGLNIIFENSHLPPGLQQCGIASPMK